MCAGSWLMSATAGSSTLRLRLPGLVALREARRGAGGGARGESAGGQAGIGGNLPTAC